MLVETSSESAAVIRNILAGKSGPPRDVVVLNAAAALWLAGKANAPQHCTTLVNEAIDSGGARDLLAQLVEESYR